MIHLMTLGSQPTQKPAQTPEQTPLAVEKGWSGIGKKRGKFVTSGNAEGHWQVARRGPEREMQWIEGSRKNSSWELDNSLVIKYPFFNSNWLESTLLFQQSLRGSRPHGS